ncbi:hypothetical protein Acr_00g0057630 [Actinidia rufa]|uniref:Uncharacterized protein n=1 Tax=Actinidia rufa TaxID=165716 RepID=A0A7J0DPN1_9ERIC|nr:hypothetical protein Acr_00g0057630 [Actinidia rufa]
MLLSSDLKNSNDLGFDPFQPQGVDEIEHSFIEGSGPNPSSGEVDMAPKFRAFGQKKTKASADPPIVADPPAIQHLTPVQDPILTLPRTTEVEASLTATRAVRKYLGQSLSFSRSANSSQMYAKGKQISLEGQSSELV